LYFVVYTLKILKNQAFSKVCMLHFFVFSSRKISIHRVRNLSKLNSLIDYLNQTCFLGILQKEFHYALYSEGTFYKRHLDTFQNDDRRKLSLVCYLNDEDWKPENGSELVLYKEENGIEVAINIYPLPGRMAIFESQMLEHEVKPVKNTRLSITGWLKTR